MTQPNRDWVTSCCRHHLHSGIEVMVTRFAPAQTDLIEIETADMQRAEAIGLPMATAVLALGAVVAATLPITVTAAGIAVAVGALFGLTTFLPFDPLVLSVATMIATGTAIDYAMFIVSRFNGELPRRGVRDRQSAEAIAAAIGSAIDTTGRIILASGFIVMISLCALAAVGLPMLNGVAVGVVVAVIATLIAGLTLLSALLATLGPAVNLGALPHLLRPAAVRSATASSVWARWRHTVMGRPALFGAIGVGLLASATPITGIRYGVDMGLTAPTDRPTGRATELIEDSFGPGLLAPIEVVAAGPDSGPAW
ncbi:MMPL family transporter [Nocardia sp. NPDC050408]|uniref:MMPL family transporter n=1 Tax=Nocardia sp. NPDC050408 TaxID=3364319 RepID=UPI00379A3741